MIILKVIGGLGNQMFEVAFARAMQLEFKEDIYLDCSVYKNYKIRSYSLNNLAISDSLKYLEESDIGTIKKIGLKLTQNIYRIYQRNKMTLKCTDIIGEKVYRSLSNNGYFYNFDRYYYSNLKNNKSEKCIYGYFQSEKYFNKYKNQIRKDLKVKSKPTEEEFNLIMEISNTNSVGVSIRIGDDYLNSKSLNVCNEEYYYRAMEYMYSINKNIIFYIFSDCEQRVKERFKFNYPVKYISGYKDYQSLRLLYSCKHFIISNSSFSWWGAYLSEYKNKKVIAPSRWYNDSSKKPDIYLDDMILIDV